MTPGRQGGLDGPGLTSMRAVQITRFGGPDVLDVVDLPEPEAGDGQKLYDVSTAGVNFADTHHALS
jgi:NADPH:quinone reductase-like Zn-dependent oxidoreductase